MLWCINTKCEPQHPLLHLKLWVIHSQHLVLWKGLFKLEVCSVKQDLIPYAGKLVLSNVPIERWIIGLFIHGLLTSPCNGVWLPTHNGEIVHPGTKTCGSGIVINEWKCPEIFLKPFPKGPYRPPYVVCHAEIMSALEIYFVIQNLEGLCSS